MVSSQRLLNENVATGTEFSASVGESGDRLSAQFRSRLLGTTGDLAEGSVRWSG